MPSAGFPMPIPTTPPAIPFLVVNVPETGTLTTKYAVIAAFSTQTGTLTTLQPSIKRNYFCRQ